MSAPEEQDRPERPDGASSSASSSSSSDKPDIIDIAGDVAHPARVYDYVRGGRDNFEADRKTAEFAASAGAGGIDHARAAVLANQAFLRRTITYLARDAGVRQFLEIGTVMPAEDSTHQIAQGIDPTCRIVYANDDPVVLAHAHALSQGTPEGAAAYVDANPRDPETILEKAGATFVPGEPVAVILVAILHHIDDQDDAHGIIRRFMEPLPSGSHLVISHLTNEIIADQVTEAAERINQMPGFTLILRTHEQISAFFDGLELVPPGLVAVTDWYPDTMPPPPPEHWPVPFYGAIGRKP